ncbi:ribosome assembly RNA-binding protein YhbY [Exiguobacterium antarcticum]|uniref:Ribosome assembly RNA-binding protein YhbY n=1 Tax=Exiguobacterium antarcticum TaxID=132920 RepID=A0ABT6QZ88_9BACL|nr:ribosome assembly RNA-binding protein YhbY [Exiguobacterium antarcticum]AFS69883.1 RNA-binding protein [Exiguobacterium antarcticum B7]MDI3234006.1 ribosome assembly RNA-binding protein YhbY [Exiguobacterium antarcticum]
MLTGKQKRYLRATAHDLSPIFQVGKNGVGEAMCADLMDALEKRELLKVQVLQNCADAPKDVAAELVDGTNADLVQVIGKVIVLYKESKENKTLQLPR